MSASNSSHCWRIAAASSGEMVSPGACGRASNLSSWRRVRSMNSKPSANVMVAVVSEKPRTVERDINTLPTMGALCRLFDPLGYYRKHPLQAIRFGGSDWLEVRAETTVSEPIVVAFLRLAELTIDGLGPEPGKGLFNPDRRPLGPFRATPGPSIPEGRLPLREAPRVQRERCHGLAERSHFNKIVASLNASTVLQGKGDKSGRSAPLKTLLRPSQGRPKRCLGVTYAEILFASSSCIVGPSLLAICTVVWRSNWKKKNSC